MTDKKQTGPQPSFGEQLANLLDLPKGTISFSINHNFRGECETTVNVSYYPDPTDVVGVVSLEQYMIVPVEQRG